MSEVEAAAKRPQGRLRSRDLLCIAGFMAGGALSLILRFATPSLLQRHPVLLEALNGSIVAIITGGAYARIGRAPLVLVVLAPLVCIAIYDVFAWWAGRLWGYWLIDSYTRQRSKRTRRWVLRTEDWVRRRGIVVLALAYFLPVPNFLIYLLCGSSGMSLVTFVIGDAIGTLLWTGLLTGLGWEAGQSAVPVVNAINRYALYITIVLVVISVAVAGRRARGSRPAVERPTNMQESPP